MNLDNITDERLAVIKELANRKPQIEPEKPFPTALYYAILSFILFAITRGLPYHKEVWFVLSGIGLIVGATLLTVKAMKWINKNSNL